ncbi:hypothetical protein [Phenylobacterium sp.]|jgi:hypothetical protein|uniref:hypothetical protein n=1 Tax=Phenylobacterium sp. TaxID=1871053 RepID=UPI002F920DD3
MGLARELKRLFGGERMSKPRDGITGGDAALLELLDLPLLLQEGKAADTAAGRVGARDRARRRLESAIVWREAARRTADAAHLRKAAATAEAAALMFQEGRRMDAWARARCEQAYCALLGAELFGDSGLNAAAEVAFKEARTRVRGGLTAPLADLGLAIVRARNEMALGDAEEARKAAARFAAPIAAFDILARRETLGRVMAAEARLVRADILCGWGARLQDADLLKAAVDDAAAAARRVDVTYEPLTFARAETLRAQALVMWGEVTADLDAISAAATTAAEVLDRLSRDDSPLDWARAQLALGQALQTLGEAALDERSYEQAVTAYDRANLVLKDAPAAALRAQCAAARALCLARSAELTGDLAVLDAAEAAMKIELSDMNARRDPVAWALAQLHLARLYEARVEITGKDRGRLAAASLALEMARDVFAEQGQRSLTLLANDALDRIQGVPRTAV